eukprot:CAMPEP_0197600976 /NCGR_PEP_ID=MMETSP1326-20131121/34396_1 /TAXON_ID=1155430 /ORGANISM="Genus nov. species nov., Strain RCC2288" /LENGTH=40 /DNA_ID= /DNA_START= /DNA_END= /DNA_ORIENTATION=
MAPLKTVPIKKKVAPAARINDDDEEDDEVLSDYEGDDSFG